MHKRGRQALQPPHITIGQADGKTSNYISTTKYNLITFLPLFLFQQFKTFGNLFFLLICIAQYLPGINPYGTNTVIIPLVTIILVAAAKEIFEDFVKFLIYFEYVKGRLVADRRVNRRLVLTCLQDEKSSSWKWERIHWAELKVGQVVKVLKNEAIPADIVLLSSSEPAGVAYIETSNLDGETNLKIRQSLHSTAWIIDDDTALAMCSCQSKLNCDPPSSALYHFRGVIKVSTMFLLLNKNKFKDTQKTEYSLGLFFQYLIIKLIFIY
ncbi:unnamed protein product [Thelazia callipaeda]|uniref:PhoLip_ATPase_N domain-containing protein n=1 Tax=Thelazia callipaeda TaxID=103827 RepID=A0A0N5CW85_THECL|nr:unnamed protein product [Thelazia callipaeda]